MVISPRHMRMMGIGAVVAGVVMVGGRLVQMVSGQAPTPVRDFGPLPVTVLGLSFALAMAASLALCIQPRERIGRTGLIGAGCLAVGFGSLLASFVLRAQALILGIERDVSSSSVNAVYVVLAIALNLWLLLLPIGFLLVGLAMAGFPRRVLVGVAVYQLVTPFVAGFLPDAVPVTAPLLGQEMSSIVLAIGVAAIGYALWSGSHATPALEPAPGRS